MREPIDGYQQRQSILLKVLQVAREIWQALAYLAFSHVLHALNGGDNNSSGRLNAGLWHDNVEIFFGAKVGAEASLIDYVIGQLHTHLLRNDGAGTVSDIAEWASVDESRRALSC